jgi:hypothetical protein
MRRGVVLALLAALVGTPAVASEDGDRTLRPAIAPAKAGTTCVADPAIMRRSHMDLLKHQRDETVHGGIRGAKASLKECVDCHASPASGSVAAEAGDFCVSCHRYAAVTIDCFECHTGKPRAVAAKATP